ncbi:MAG: hypothetical protein ABSD44_10475 [Terracidiphilus sp.]
MWLGKAPAGSHTEACSWLTWGGAEIGFAVPIRGIRTTGIVRCDQTRVLDLAAQGGRRVDALPPETLEEVLAKAGTLFE